MKPDPRFSSQGSDFWALVRTLSEHLGYTKRAPRGAPKGSGALKKHSIEQMRRALEELDLDPGLVGTADSPTAMGVLLEMYFSYRADLLTIEVEPLLMDAADARELFQKYFNESGQGAVIPYNKQKGGKYDYSYLTGLVNILFKKHLQGQACDYSPSQLTTFTRDRVPLQTLARRVDGALPSAVNPKAVWEIKEYYYTTTFGSRVADGVYETLLDGTELRELKLTHGIAVEHFLFVDSRYTWWVCGKSYLCRLIDMLNMGLVSEVVFGKEVETAVPAMAARLLDAP